MSFYAPDKKHHWVLLDEREHAEFAPVIQIGEKYFIARNYAGQCWGYEIEKIEKEQDEPHA